MSTVWWRLSCEGRLSCEVFLKRSMASSRGVMLAGVWLGVWGGRGTVVFQDDAETVAFVAGHYAFFL